MPLSIITDFYNWQNKHTHANKEKQPLPVLFENPANKHKRGIEINKPHHTNQEVTKTSQYFHESYKSDCYETSLYFNTMVKLNSNVSLVVETIYCMYNIKDR